MLECLETSLSVGLRTVVDVASRCIERLEEARVRGDEPPQRLFDVGTQSPQSWKIEGLFLDEVGLEGVSQLAAGNFRVGPEECVRRRLKEVVELLVGRLNLGKRLRISCLGISCVGHRLFQSVLDKCGTVFDLILPYAENVG